MDGFSSLTKSEHLIIKAMLDGYWTNEQIAEHLIVSPLTVKSHMQNIFRKTGVGNRLELCIRYLTKNTLFGA